MDELVNVFIPFTRNELLALYEACCDAHEGDSGYDDDHPFKSAVEKLEEALKTLGEE